MSEPGASRTSLLEAQDVQVWFGDARRPVRAVDGVSIRIDPGESVGLVGESGCGKTTLGRALLRLVDVRAGRILFEGRDIAALRGRELKTFRQRAQMVFQDPFGSLNPRMPVGRALEEVLYVHGMAGRAARRARACELFTSVGLDPIYLDRFPHEFSGGQRQRIGMARALALNPRLVIADEPVSALDVSVQVQILNLMKRLQQEMDLAYLFVAHDLAVVRYVCDRIVVMYLGRIMEEGPAEQVYRQPAHPYTQAILESVPDVRRGLAARASGGRARAVLQGDVPSFAVGLGGCPFHPRCPLATARCRDERPGPARVAAGRMSACHFAADVLSGSVGLRREDALRP